MIYIQKKAKTWNGLSMMVNGHISAAGLVTPSNVTSVIRLNFEDVESIFDQFAALGNIELNSVVIDIAGKMYTFTSEMANELFRVVSVACNDHEGLYADEEFLPEAEWTEEYLLAL